MKPAVWQYEDPDKQTVYFRGYVKIYNENVVTRKVCPEVRGNKWKAKEDAEKLLKKLKKTVCQESPTTSS
jgi:translation initiation factor 1 (eIF-1/SUI1)